MLYLELLVWGFLLVPLSHTCLECNGSYVAPCNMKFPYGDENEMGADITANDTNTIVCRERSQYEPEFGRCPFPPEDPGDLKLTDPYIHCPQFVAGPAKANLEGVALASADVLCKKCDVQLTPDGTAVNLKCLGCLDLPSLERTANLSEKDMAFTAYFVEISNYTSVQVQGTENFNNKPLT